MKRIAEHPDAAVIEHLGGTSAVARMCKIEAPSVTKWKKTGIPQARSMYLRVLHPEAFLSASPDTASSHPAGQ